MISSVAGMSKKLPAWTREFDSLVRAIGECKSKAEEDAIICREVEVLKPRLKDARLDKRLLKEVLVRLIYVEMLGHDASWGHVKALQACSEQHLPTKKVAYLASSLFLDSNSDLIILVVNTLLQDLKSENYLTVCAALTAACKLIGPDLVTAVLPAATELLGHPREPVRKKAVMLLHRFEQLDPAHDGPLHATDLGKHFRQALCDKDPSVMGAALCALCEVAGRDPKPYKNLVPSFVSILKQVAEHRLPKAYDYHRTPAPFIQIKLLRVLARLGAGDRGASEHMYAVIGDCLRKGASGHTIGHAIVAECVRTVAAIYPHAPLQQAAAAAVAGLLAAGSHNLRYVGIDCLSRLVRLNASYAGEHQLAVIDCLEDADETLRKKTLELLFRMTNPGNIEVIVEKMVDYLRSTTDEVQKADVVRRLAELAERFAPDTRWFVDTMNRVFLLGGSVVEPSLADSLTRLIAEGAGEDDAGADAQLRAEAVGSYLRLLDDPKLPDVLLRIICWVLGEYGTASGRPAAEVMDRLAAAAEARSASPAARRLLVSALTKLAAQAGAGLPPAAGELVAEAAASADADLQQRALEQAALLSLPRDAQQRALPPDASAEDLDVDPGLGFLDGFVAAAAAAGAPPYLGAAERADMGAVRPSAAGSAAAAAADTHALRFAAYERQAAPVAERDPSPVREVALRPGTGSSAASPEPAAAGPQLALRTGGGRQARWGPASFAPPSGGGVGGGAAQQQQSGGSGAAGGGYASAPPPPAPRSPEPEVTGERAALAGLLFGGGGGDGRAAARRPAAKRAGVSPSKPPPPQQPAADLLDLGGGAAEAPAAAVSAQAPPAGDPFAMLQQLDSQPAASAQQQQPQQQQDASDPFGLGSLSAPPPPAAGLPQAPAPAAASADPFGLGQLGGFGSPAAAAAPKPAPSQALPQPGNGGGRGMTRPGAMAGGRGSAAPPPLPAKKADPFADLFS